MMKQLKQLSSRSLWIFGITMVVTVILSMSRSLALNIARVPLQVYLRFAIIAVPAWIVANAVVAVLVIRYWKQIWTKWFAERIALYLGFLYFLQLTYYINARGHHWWNLFANNFFQVETLVLFLPAIVYILCARLFPKLQQVEKRAPRWTYPNWDRLLLTVGISLSPIVVSYFRDVYIDADWVWHGRWFFTQAPFHLVLLFIGVYILLGYLHRGFGDLRRNQSTVASSFTISLIFALICNYGYQWSMAGTSSYYGRYLFPGAIVFQVLCLTLINILISMIVNRQVFAGFVILLANVGLIVANYIKFNYRSEPLTPKDFKWIGDIGMILSFINIWSVVWILVGVVLLVLVYLRLRKKWLLGKIETSWKKRLFSVLVILVVILGMGTAIRNERDHKIIEGIPVLSPENNWRNVDWKGYTFVARYRSLSFLWLQQLSKESMQKPEGYSQKAMEAIIRKYEKRAAEINEHRNRNIADQTVIYILSESFADPNRLSNVTVSQNVVPQIEGIMKQTTSGLMRSDHYGGGTANIEFQVNSGLPFSNYNSSISAVYLDIAPSMKKFPSISDLFHPSDRIAIHPYFDTSYNRNLIYKQLDFFKFLSLNSKTDPIQVTPEDYIGNYVSDAKTYQTILDNINAGNNQFFDVMTMQNHVEWKSDQPQAITAFGNEFSQEDNDRLTNYVRLLSYTDSATADFLSKLKQIDKDITVVFYGDHLPGLYPESTFADHPELQYQTDYFIWSNFDTDMKRYPLVKPSDLTALMLETTQSKVTPYYALLTDVLHQEKDGETPDPQIAEDLKLVQYDITAGKGYLAKDQDFFIQEP